MTTEIDVVQLAAEHAALQAQATQIAQRLKQVTTSLLALGAGKHPAGNLTVTISSTRRFNQAQAETMLAANPELLSACYETSFSSTRAKQVLPPALYEACMVPAGAPRVTVK